mmetsp:Transcript_19616/g.38185  ORF Transcript_19616/g.38185 Transcript_19616/m.38185 type:complete len:611 (+) Transcript_19616:430-2262(+)
MLVSGDAAGERHLAHAWQVLSLEVAVGRGGDDWAWDHEHGGDRGAEHDVNGKDEQMRQVEDDDHLGGAVDPQVALAGPADRVEVEQVARVEKVCEDAIGDGEDDGDGRDDGVGDADEDGVDELGEHRVVRLGRVGRLVLAQHPELLLNVGDDDGHEEGPLAKGEREEHLHREVAAEENGVARELCADGGEEAAHVLGDALDHGEDDKGGGAERDADEVPEQVEAEEEREGVGHRHGAVGEALCARERHANRRQQREEDDEGQARKQALHQALDRVGQLFDDVGKPVVVVERDEQREASHRDEVEQEHEPEEHLAHNLLGFVRLGSLWLEHFLIQIVGQRRGEDRHGALAAHAHLLGRVCRPVAAKQDKVVEAAVVRQTLLALLQERGVRIGQLSLRLVAQLADLLLPAAHARCVVRVLGSQMLRTPSEHFVFCEQLGQAARVANHGYAQNLVWKHLIKERACFLSFERLVKGKVVHQHGTTVFVGAVGERSGPPINHNEPGLPKQIYDPECEAILSDERNDDSCPWSRILVSSYVKGNICERDHGQPSSRIAFLVCIGGCVVARKVDHSKKEADDAEPRKHLDRHSHEKNEYKTIKPSMLLKLIVAHTID